MPDPVEVFDAWNPGLSSEIPASILPRVTLYDPENAETDYPTALEAAGYCGLKPQDMTVFKVSRLALHEVLIRITADLYVSGGPNCKRCFTCQSSTGVTAQCPSAYDLEHASQVSMRFNFVQLTGFDNRRLLAPIGYIPPAEAEERYYAQLNTLDMVA